MVKLRKLEWVDADEGMCTKWRAAALGGHYELVDFGKDDPGFAVNFHWGRPLSFWFIQGEPDEHGPTGPKIFPTLDEAKDAAQADYERRILSALETTPPDGQQEPVAHAYIVDGECEQIERGTEICLPDDPSLVLLYARPSEHVVTDEMVEAGARAIAQAWGENWECCCTERRGLDCDCGDAMTDERDRYDDRLSRDDCRTAARAALKAAMETKK